MFFKTASMLFLYGLSVLLTFAAAGSFSFRIWLSVACLLFLLSVFLLVKGMNKKGFMQAAISGGTAVNSLFIGVGPYLNQYVKGIAFVTSILGFILSLTMMAFMHAYLKQKEDYSVRIKKVNVKEEGKKKKNLSDRRKDFFWIIERQNELKSTHLFLLRWQIAYVERLEERQKKEEKNAIDFVLGKKVELENSEVD